MTRVYEQSPRVAARNFRGEMAFITPEDRRINILNKVATEIWELCRSARSVVQLCEVLEHRYDDKDEAMREDVQALLDTLVEMGALLCHERNEGTP